jgi:hypothetical protein
MKLHLGLTVMRRCAHRAHARLTTDAAGSIFSEFDMPPPTGRSKCTGPSTARRWIDHRARQIQSGSSDQVRAAGLAGPKTSSY